MYYVLRTISYFLTWGVLYGLLLGGLTGTALIPLAGTFFGILFGAMGGLIGGIIASLAAIVFQTTRIDIDTNLDLHRRQVAWQIGASVVLIPLLVWVTGSFLIRGFIELGLVLPLALPWAGLAAAHVAHHYPDVIVKDMTKGKRGLLEDYEEDLHPQLSIQDAWAIFTHHLMYKHEDQIPDSIKRELHALAGALETADTAFQAIRDKRDRYIESVNLATERESLIGVSTNLDSLLEYLLREFPGQKLETHYGELSQFLQTLPRQRYPTLKQIDDAIEATKEVRPWFYEESGSATPEDGRSAAFEMIRALWIMDDELREKTRIVRKQKELLKEAKERTVTREE